MCCIERQYVALAGNGIRFEPPPVQLFLDILGSRIVWILWHKLRATDRQNDPSSHSESKANEFTKRFGTLFSCPLLTTVPGKEPQWPGNACELISCYPFRRVRHILKQTHAPMTI